MMEAFIQIQTAVISASVTATAPTHTKKLMMMMKMIQMRLSGMKQTNLTVMMTLNTKLNITRVLATSQSTRLRS